MDVLAALGRVDVLAVLGGIAVLAVVVVVLLKSKHSPSSYQEPPPINYSIGVIGMLSKTFELAQLFTLSHD